MSGRWDQTPDQYDHPSDHETRVSEAAAAVRAVPKRPRVMRVSGDLPLVTHGASAFDMLPGPEFPEMAAADYPDEPRTPSRWERVRDVLRSIRWTW